MQFAVLDHPLLILPVAVPLDHQLLPLVAAAAVRLLPPVTPAHLPLQGDEDARPATPVHLRDDTPGLVRIGQGRAAAPRHGDVTIRRVHYVHQAALALPHAMASAADVPQVPAQVVGTDDAVPHAQFRVPLLVSVRWTTHQGSGVA